MNNEKTIEGWKSEVNELLLLLLFVLSTSINSLHKKDLHNSDPMRADRKSEKNMNGAKIVC